MVKGVEEFRPNLQRHAFPNHGVFVQRQVPVVQSWSVKEAARRGAEGPEGRQAETGPGHPEMAVGTGIAGILELAGKIRHVDAGGAGKGLVKCPKKADWESGREARDARNFPPIYQTLWEAGEGLGERYRVGITPDEIVSNIKVRQRPAERVIRKVYTVVEE